MSLRNEVLERYYDAIYEEVEMTEANELARKYLEERPGLYIDPLRWYEVNMRVNKLSHDLREMKELLIALALAKINQYDKENVCEIL